MADDGKIWVYQLRRDGSGTEHLVKQVEPGDILTIERPDQEGICDLYVLWERSDAFLVATYEWAAEGTPEECMAALKELLDLRKGQE
jgi:hypothetical protein